MQRVETENDIGRDAFVDLVDGTDVTGGVICVQVKSGKSFLHEGQWVIPGEAADFTLWRESTVPFFGAVQDPEDDALRWVDLSQAAALAVDAYISPVIPGPYGKPCVPVPAENRLDVDLAPFLDAAKTSLRRQSGSPAAAFLAEHEETVERGIVDTFAVGRHDPTAFLLLGALFHRLPKACRRLAVGTLALTTSHPDVFWTKQNWIPELVSTTVRTRCRWTAIDIAALLDEIDETGMDRGTIGQTVFHVLNLRVATRRSPAPNGLRSSSTAGPDTSAVVATIALCEPRDPVYQAGPGDRTPVRRVLRSSRDEYDPSDRPSLTVRLVIRARTVTRS